MDDHCLRNYSDYELQLYKYVIRIQQTKLCWINFLYKDIRVLIYLLFDGATQILNKKSGGG